MVSNVESTIRNYTFRSHHPIIVVVTLVDDVERPFLLEVVVTCRRCGSGSGQ